jgi:hypothetical protein
MPINKYQKKIKKLTTELVKEKIRIKWIEAFTTWWNNSKEREYIKSTFNNCVNCEDVDARESGRGIIGKRPKLLTSMSEYIFEEQAKWYYLKVGKWWKIWGEETLNTLLNGCDKKCEEKQKGIYEILGFEKLFGIDTLISKAIISQYDDKDIKKTKKGLFGRTIIDEKEEKTYISDIVNGMFDAISVTITIPPKLVYRGYKLVDIEGLATTEYSISFVVPAWKKKENPILLSIWIDDGNVMVADELIEYKDEIFTMDTSKIDGWKRKAVKAKLLPVTVKNNPVYDPFPFATQIRRREHNLYKKLRY